MSCCLCWWRASCCIFPLETTCCGVRWTARADVRGRVCKKVEKTRDWIFSICSIGLPVPWSFILYPSHPAAKLQPDCSRQACYVQDLKGLPFSCVLFNKLVAVRLVGRKLPFKECRVLPWLWPKKNQKPEENPSSRYRKIVKFENRLPKICPALQPLVKDWSENAGHEFTVSFGHKRTISFRREKITQMLDLLTWFLVLQAIFCTSGWVLPCH